MHEVQHKWEIQMKMTETSSHGNRGRAINAPDSGRTNGRAQLNICASIWNHLENVKLFLRASLSKQYPPTSKPGMKLSSGLWTLSVLPTASGQQTHGQQFNSHAEHAPAIVHESTRFAKSDRWSKQTQLCTSKMRRLTREKKIIYSCVHFSADIYNLWFSRIRAEHDTKKVSVFLQAPH